MRICSLLPSATEIVYALGLGDRLVGVSHACDYPDDAATKPVVSRSVRQITHLSSEEIDGIVQQARANGNPLYWIDEDLLRELRPDLIITQELCEVCAISSGSVFETAAKVFDYQPEILTIRPNSVADILQNVRNIASAAGAAQRGQDLTESLQSRIRAVVGGVAPMSIGEAASMAARGDLGNDAAVRLMLGELRENEIGRDFALLRHDRGCGLVAAGLDAQNDHGTPGLPVEGRSGAGLYTELA